MRPSPATAENIATAADAIQRGDLVVFPTETVYGLGANACDGRAVAKIFALKRRPQFNPLIIHVNGRAQAEKIAVFNEQAHLLAEAHWPGPLTLVVPARPDNGISDLCTAGLPTIAIRHPAHPIAQQLLTCTDRPIAAPSANPSQHISPTLARHVANYFSDGVAMILDGGASAIGIESTIIDASRTQPQLLRSGAILASSLTEIVGRPVLSAQKSARPTAPGQLDRHYAPATPLRMNAGDVQTGEGLITFGEIDVPGESRCAMQLNLSPRGDLHEAAANLFAYLHQMDALRLECIKVVPIPDTGLGYAINDRLRRAST